MKTNLLKVAFVAAIALVSSINVFNAQKSEKLFDMILANVDALAVLEDEHRYIERKEDSMQVWDDNTQTYKKITVIVCEGKGSLSC